MVLPLKLPLGTSEFRKLRQSDTYYADKTDLIRELIDLPQDAVLFPRPRRFGKTTNLSMLRAFFGKHSEDLSGLFAGLAIWQAGPEYRAHFGRYPVISLSFKEVKAATWDECRSAIAIALSRGFAEHEELLSEAKLSAGERRLVQAIVDRQQLTSDTAAALLDLSAILHRHHGQPALILIDEYDTPILSGYQYGYLDQVSLFFRNLLSGALKDNRHLFKGVLTGVLRIGRENLFSGLNSIITHDLMDRRFATAFGFTEDEVEQLMVRLGHPEVLPELRAWYNGYNFAGQIIYNPWSVLSYAANPERGFVPYWVQTSSDDALRGLVLQRAFYVLPEFQRLLLGQTIEKPISDHVTLRELHNSPDGIWSLMLHAGYLKYVKVRTDPAEARLYAELCIPNQEIRYVFVQSVLSWIASSEQGTQPLDELLAAMLKGDTEVFGSRLFDMALRVLSFQDTAGPETEKVYQAFALGLLVKLLPRYEVDSNRESGLGRYDVLALPKEAGQPGVVLEFKVADTPSAAAVRRALREALTQIAHKGYGERLRQRGAAPILCYGVACHGKQVWVQRGGSSAIYGAPLRKPARTSRKATGPKRTSRPAAKTSH
jgi:hypothetical protein